MFHRFYDPAVIDPEFAWNLWGEFGICSELQFERKLLWTYSEKNKLTA